MKVDKLFGKTQKTVHNFDSRNQELLTKAGFISQVASGIYNFLPLGKRVLDKIVQIVRKRMEHIGAQEILMPILHPKILWEKTGRWNSVDVLFKTKSRFGFEFGIAPTHEETVTPLAKIYVKSYKDLPLALYHITPKFRDEPRPKSGILRGREFIMKDLYSFHSSSDDLRKYYNQVIEAYFKIFKECGFNDIWLTEASGGSFTKKHSHEFNILTPAGEVDLVLCRHCHFCQNIELMDQKNSHKSCPKCHHQLEKNRAIEVGNIFDLGTGFSEDFDFFYIDRDGQKKPVYMGCYGIGITRIIGTLVELYHDNAGIIWPESVAPFKVYLIGLDLSNQEVLNYSEKLYSLFVEKNIEVLFDNRINVTAGEKFADCDLIGLPWRVVVSKKTIPLIEIKKRNEKKTKLMKIDQFIRSISF